MFRRPCALLAAVVALCAVGSARAAAGVVSHVQVLSDKVPDVSSLAAWKRAFIRDDMTDRQKAMACWKTVVTFQHQDDPPAEYLQNEDLVLDAIKMFNVYGYSLCSVAASHVQTLARYVGLEARGWTIRGHVVPEVFYDRGWHMLDASLIDYFPTDDGSEASVADIEAAVKDWLDKNPGFRANDAKLRAFQQENGWSGWRRGPRLLAACPFYDAGGWWPAGTHGWYATMQEYDGSTLFPYSSGFSQGYEVNLQLRPGERLTRNWSNRGLQINGGAGPGCLKLVTGHDNLRYTPKYGDLAPGRVGNGDLTWDVPLDARLADVALSADNVTSGAAGAAVKDAAQPGSFVLRLPSSYVYLRGELACAAVMAAGGAVAVDFSDNQGLDWKPVTEWTASGAQTLDLTKLVLRRYDYRLRFTLRGAGTALSGLRISHVVQHSQRPLPALDQGPNRITFSSARQEGTISLEGSTNPANRGKQVLWTDFHPVLSHCAGESFRPAGNGSVTFPVSTPGDMTHLRTSCFYRARDAKDTWEVQVSFDAGQTFQTLGKMHGPGVHLTAFTPDVTPPPGTRAALVRWVGSERNTAAVFNFRIDADYAEPHGAFAPVKVTYRWTEDGQAKEDGHVARSVQETYNIDCAGKPTMTSISEELAP
jgi:hypothetical protein